MTDGDAPVGARDDRLWHSLAVLALLVVPLGAGAYWAYPTWDDGLFWFQLNDLGPSIWKTASGERPVLGYLLRQLGEHGLLPGSLGVFFAITWLGTGLVARSYWREFFPAWRPLAPVVTALAVAPVLIQTQLIAVYPIVSAHLACVVTLVVCILVGRPWRRTVPLWVARLVGALVVFAASLISEYPVLATIVGSLSLAASGRDDLPAVYRPKRLSWLILCAAAVAGYLVYHGTSSLEARPEIKPEVALVTQGARRLLELPVRVPFAIWAGALGEFFRGIGQITFFSGSIVGLAYGGLLGAGAFLLLRRRIATSEVISPNSKHTRTAGLLVVVLGLGLVPIILMATSPQQNIGSRLWFPLFPIPICLTVWLLVCAVRPRFHIVMAVGSIFLSGYLCANAAATARNIRRSTDALGSVIRERLAPAGLTVALFTSYPTNSFVGSPTPRPYELAARLSRNWTKEERHRFWAGATEWEPLASHMRHFTGACAPVAELESTTGGWVRRGPIQRLLWVSLSADGKYQINSGAAGAPPLRCPETQGN